MITGKVEIIKIKVAHKQLHRFSYRVLDSVGLPIAHGAIYTTKIAAKESVTVLRSALINPVMVEAKE